MLDLAHIRRSIIVKIYFLLFM